MKIRLVVNWWGHGDVVTVPDPKNMSGGLILWSMKLCLMSS